MSQTPTIGRIVHYRLSANDVLSINSSRSSGSAVEEISGAQMRHGNPVSEGDTVPLAIVRVWPDEYGPGIPGVNGQALLDGTDSLWVTSAAEGTGPGQWSWPPRA